MRNMCDISQSSDCDLAQAPNHPQLHKKGNFRTAKVMDIIMKCAADFRSIARLALRGKWCLSALTTFVASLIGAQIASAGSGGGSGSDENSGIDLGKFFSEDVLNLFRVVLLAMLVYAVVHIVVVLIIGGAGKLGYAKYNLNLVDGGEARLDDLFSQFHRLGAGFEMNFLMFVYLLLWSFLFVIPAIIKAFSYAMTPYILYEHPEISPNDAITRSREMMDGNKFRLFCLNLSFIGWFFAAALPAILGVIAVLFGNFLLLLPLILVSWAADLFVCAYMEAANAAFYRDVSGMAFREAEAFTEQEP